MIGIILAGGSGSRLWPFSRTMSPKQFLNLGSTHESLLQETFKRISALVRKDRTFIVGSKYHEVELVRQVRQVCENFPIENILLEPIGCNTAPAILWALSHIPESLRDEPIVILPADHLIQREKRFLEYLQRGQSLAKEGFIVTFGIRPDRLETGYGYIKSGKSVGTGYRVERFEEKPNRKKAEEFISSEDYSWNSGIFMSTPRVLLSEYRKLCPTLFSYFFDSDFKPLSGKEEGEDTGERFERIDPISIDYAILEKSDKVAVIPMDIVWSDLGSWESIYRMSRKDRNGNTTRGNVILQDSKNCLVFSDKRLITCVGLENVILVETADALLLCDLKRSQDVKRLVETLKEEERGEYKFHTKVVRPWGSHQDIYRGSGCKIRLMKILPGKSISTHRHFHRSEHWVVVEGTAKVSKAGNGFYLTENESTFTAKATLHSLKNPGSVPLRVIEVQQGDYIDENDIHRQK